MGWFNKSVSKTYKTMNMYDLINAEMKRLYDSRDYFIKMAMTAGGKANNEYFNTKAKETEAEIQKRRDTIFAQFDGYDEKIQEKVAEAALMGISDNNDD